MNLKTFSTIWTVIYFGWGLGLLVDPAGMMAVYGLTLDGGGSLMARIVGAALVGLGSTYWLNRTLPSTERGWHNLLLTSFIYNVICVPVTLQATLDGTMSAMGYMAVVLHLFLTATFGYFAFKK